MGQNIEFVGLFMDILESYLFFVKQKGVINDKDEAIPQICEVVEAKLAEEVPEESKEAVAVAKQRWVELKQKINSWKLWLDWFIPYWIGFIFDGDI